MKKILVIGFVIILGALFFIYKGHFIKKSQQLILENTIIQSTMKLSSSVFEHNGGIPTRYTCDGENISPPFSISGVPEKAKSLVLIMDDPDAVKPAGKVWDHWIIWNLSPGILEIKEGDELEGVPGMGSSQKLVYSGPCPPDGRHRYYFKLYALDIKLDISKGSAKPIVEQVMEGHILDQAELVGLYTRN